MQKRPSSLLATLLSRLGGRTASPAREPKSALRPYQAISIFHGTVCCTAAKQLDGVRVLARNAPALPLAQCTMRPKCDCRYIKHSDRRGGPRRIMEFGLQPTLFAAKERRNAKGRRTKD